MAGHYASHFFSTLYQLPLLVDGLLICSVLPVSRASSFRLEPCGHDYPARRVP